MSLSNSLVWVICAVSLQFTLGFSLIVACGAVTLGVTLALPATSLNAPGGVATYHWLNTDRIALLPRGAVVVNAVRGTLIDDAALIAALKSGQVGFAGLDVFEGEPKLNPGYLDLES